MSTATDNRPEPYLIRGEWRSRPIPVWHEDVQQWAMAIARQLDNWNRDQTAIEYEILSNPGFQFRQHPPTLCRVPLAVVRGRIPTVESNWVPGLPLVVVEVMDGPERYGDLWDRVAEYLDCGVPVVWVFTPRDRTITFHRPDEAVLGVDSRGTLTGDPELPGFSCPVAGFFR